MKQTRLQRWKKTWLGRALCRVAGEEKGAVMMEYVIVAVLIAGACVLAVAMFGRTIVQMFGVASESVTGNHTGAHTTLENTQGAATDGAKAASEYHDSMHK